jgi:hypothetical protein
VARLAIAEGFLGEYAKLDKDVQTAEELRHILAHPFAAWRTFLHPSQRDIAYQASYAGPAQGDRRPPRPLPGPAGPADRP